MLRASDVPISKAIDEAFCGQTSGQATIRWQSLVIRTHCNVYFIPDQIRALIDSCLDKRNLAVDVCLHPGRSLERSKDR